VPVSSMQGFKTEKCFPMLYLIAIDSCHIINKQHQITIIWFAKAFNIMQLMQTKKYLYICVHVI